MPQPYYPACCTYRASCGRSVCCIIDIFILRAVEEKCAAIPIFFSPHAVEKQCAALPIPLLSSSGGEVSCITGNFTQQAVDKKWAALSIFLHSKKWRRRELHACKESNFKTFLSLAEHVTDSSKRRSLQWHWKLLPSRGFKISCWFPSPALWQITIATGRLSL